MFSLAGRHTKAPLCAGMLHGTGGAVSTSAPGDTSAVWPFDHTTSTDASSFNHDIDGIVAAPALAFMLTVDTLRKEMMPS